MKTYTGPFLVNSTKTGNYLVPKFARETSFYKKAEIYWQNGIYTLRSYKTNVAYFDSNTQTLTINSWYSVTTARHIKEFARQAGFEIGGKHDIQFGRVYTKENPVLNLVF